MILIQLLPLIVIGAVAVLAALWLRWVNANFDYQCSNCGAIFSLSGWEALTAFHMMGAKLVRCPNCGQMTWARPVRR